jgi:hypothetical protein
MPNHSAALGDASLRGENMDASFGCFVRREATDACLSFSTHTHIHTVFKMSWRSEGTL